METIFEKSKKVLNNNLSDDLDGLSDDQIFEYIKLENFAISFGNEISEKKYIILVSCPNMKFKYKKIYSNSKYFNKVCISLIRSESYNYGRMPTIFKSQLDFAEVAIFNSPQLWNQIPLRLKTFKFLQENTIKNVKLFRFLEVKEVNSSLIF